MVELIRIRILPRNSLKPYPLSLFFKNKKKGTRVRRESIKPGYESPKKKKKELIGKSIMIRLHLKKCQDIILSSWFWTAMWTYNQVVASIPTRCSNKINR